MKKVLKAKKHVNTHIKEELTYGKNFLVKWANALTAHTDKPVTKFKLKP